LKSSRIDHTETQRKLCLKKDLIELSYWIDELEFIHRELDTLIALENQLLNHSTFLQNIKGLRRKNTLAMGMFCQYEKELRTEFEYGKIAYEVTRAKVHEKKRASYVSLIQDFRALKHDFYKLLRTYTTT
tara:strand:+ start:38173 stop:38562 length:390 start_codon:yes stop_codon:yes gene_type:complete